MKNEVDLEELIYNIKKVRSEMEYEILEAVRKFQKRTNLSVTKIELEKVEMSDGMILTTGVVTEVTL